MARDCSECGKTFSTKQQYELHVRIHTGEKPYKCPTCDKCFRQDVHLRTHIRLHTGEKPFKCSFCDKKFPSSIGLRAHSYTHTGFPYKCPICPAEFGFPGKLKIHSRAHTGEKPFECSECDMKFTSNKTLLQHMFVHTMGKSFICNLCPKKYRTKSNLREHLKTHTGEPIKCEICDFQTFQEKYLKWHFKRQHNSEDLPLLQCNMCVKTFTSKGGLECHTRTHTGEKPYKCKFCDKSFISSSGMRTCIRKHTEEKPCEKQTNPQKRKICFKLYQSQSHMVGNKGGKAFHCTQCPKKCRHQHALDEHLVIHNGGNYKCTFCPKDFPTPRTLAEHLLFHNGEKPFKCSLCPYRSRYAVGKSHRMYHEKDDKFKCRLCTFSCQINGRIVLHEQNEHGADIVAMVNNCNSPLKAHASRGSHPPPFTCNECKYSGFTEKHLCIHYSQCHSLPQVIIKKLNEK